MSSSNMSQFQASSTSLPTALRTISTAAPILGVGTAGTALATRILPLTVNNSTFKSVASFLSNNNAIAWGLGTAILGLAGSVMLSDPTNSAKVDNAALSAERTARSVGDHATHAPREAQQSVGDGLIDGGKNVKSV